MRSLLASPRLRAAVPSPRSTSDAFLPRAAAAAVALRHKSSAASDLPSDIDTCIVGGGVTGAAILYNLGLVGAGSSAAIFEKATLTAGATWHAAGLVTYYHGGNNFKFWHQEGIELYKKWQNEEGIPLSFNQPGSMRLLQNAERVKEAQYSLSKSKLYQGLFGGTVGKGEMHMIGPDQVKELHPLVNTEGIVGALYTEGDGHIDPSSVTQTYASKAKALGGRIFENTEVVDLQCMPDGTWEVTVSTKTGETHVVRARRVVNCSGLWAKRLGDMAGVHTPAVVLQHQYLITEPIPEVKAYHEKHGHQLPILRDLEGSYYLRDEGEGLLIGPYEREDLIQLAPSSWKGSMPPGESYFLFDGDIERVMESMEAATTLLPVLERTGIKTVLNGPTCWPADGNHLVGPSYEKPNFWQACAESYGIAHGAGLGRYLVHWMQEGEPPYELTETDPARYGAWATTDWVGEKVKEAYGWNNFTAYFNENRPRARPVVHPERPQADIVEVLRSRGAQLGFSHGWETPSWFHSEAVDLKNSRASFHRPSYMEAVRRECQQVVDHAGLAYWPFAHYRITGAGAPAFLDRMIANKLPAVGRVGLGHLLTPKGKVYSELTFVRLAEEEFYITGYANFQLHDLRWLNTHLGKDEQVIIEDVSSERAVLFVNGPKADETTAKLLDEPVDLSRTEFKPFQHRRLKLDGADVLAVRMSFIGEFGLELHCERSQVARLYQRLQEVDPELGNWGGATMNSFRIEKGVPLFGKDFTKDHDAFEACLDRFVKLDKGDFVGRDALLKIKAAGGPARKMVQIEVAVGDGDVDCTGNEPLRCPDTGKVVGFTTSGTWGSLSEKSLALGYVYGPERWADGTRLQVDLLGKKVDCFVREKAAMASAAVRAKRATAAA